APANTGSTTSFTLSLKNMGMTYPDGTVDPGIQIKSRQIVGPDAAQFQLGTLSTVNVSRGTTATLAVQFKPTSIGIKNAALIIYHNNSSAPIRIPLYGVA